jgi:hypothetical protein
MAGIEAVSKTQLEQDRERYKRGTTAQNPEPENRNAQAQLHFVAGLMGL